MKNFVLRTFVLFFFFSFLLAEDGDIISYNQQTSLDFTLQVRLIQCYFKELLKAQVHA